MKLFSLGLTLLMCIAVTIVEAENAAHAADFSIRHEVPAAKTVSKN